MGKKRPPEAAGYISATAPIALHAGDTLTYTFKFSEATTATATTTDYTYTYHPNTSTTFHGGWWAMPEGGQPPMWTPHTNTFITSTTITAPVASPSPNVKWLLPTSASPPRITDEPLDETIRKQIEDAKLSPHAALVGYRAWVVDIDNEFGPMLRSLISPALWPYRKELCAHRLSPQEDKGFWGGTPNGIHAARSAEHLQTMGYEGMSKVTGEVYLWGRIIHGKLGYRAEKAYPKLIRAARNYWWLKDLAERYGIPYEVG